MTRLTTVAALIAGGALAVAGLDLLVRWADRHLDAWSDRERLRETARMDAEFRGMTADGWREIEREIFGGQP